MKIELNYEVQDYEFQESHYEFQESHYMLIYYVCRLFLTRSNFADV